MKFDLKNKKMWIVLASIIVVGFLIYQFSGDPAVEDGLYLDEGIDPIEEILGRDVLNLVSKMKGVKLDTSIFEDEAFASLEDFAVEIPKQPIGRRDPFAPF